MNREIKFRGIRVDSGEFVYGYLFEHIWKKGHNSYIIKGGFIAVKTMPSKNFIEVIPETVGMFMCLDNDGKDVFEGDIRSFKQGVGVVAWEDGAFAVFSPGSEAIDWENSSFFIESYLLGNIHQDKSLLG